MANFLLTWGTAGSPNNGPQSIQYREYGTSTWITYSTEAAGVTTKTILGLNDNYVYEFRILNNCLNGSTSPSNIMQRYLAECPVFTKLLSPNCGSIEFSFDEIGGSFITKYIVKLYTATGVTPISAFTFTPTGIAGTNVGDIFTNLLPNTLYYVQIVMEITGSSVYTINCDKYPVTTDPADPCNPVEDVTFSLVGTTLTISWSEPTPAAGVGYEIYYRKVGTTTYSMVSVATGITTKNIIVAAGFDYEGYIISVCTPCCTGNPACKRISTPVDFVTVSNNLSVVNSYNTASILNVFAGEGTGDITTDFSSLPGGVLPYGQTGTGSHTAFSGNTICVEIAGNIIATGAGYISILLNGSTELECIDVPAGDYSGDSYIACTTGNFTFAETDILTIIFENGTCGGAG